MWSHDYLEWVPMHPTPSSSDRDLWETSLDATQQSYSARLLHFTPFCNHEEISDSLCMPASVILLSAFIEDAIGSCTGQCICNWLNGLHLWHLYNCTDWYGKDSWISSLSKSVDNKGTVFKQSPHKPITWLHLLTLQNNLISQPPMIQQFGSQLWLPFVTVDILAGYSSTLHNHSHWNMIQLMELLSPSLMLTDRKSSCFTSSGLKLLVVTVGNASWLLPMISFVLSGLLRTISTLIILQISTLLFVHFMMVPVGLI